VPTVAESGYPNFDVAPWYGFWAPAGTPADIVRKLNEEIGQILGMPELIERMNGMGAELIGGSVESFAAFHQKEFDRWTTFISATGAKGQ
jgi:tripartite-type tricarboxylate transporter receptor subunit TctC